MALPMTNITTTMVGNELGSASRNVGVLCLGPNINPNSYGKPVSLIAPGSGYIEGGSAKPHGIYRTGYGATLYYNKPTGGASDPFRLGDFRGYNHLASRSTNLTIQSVRDITYGSTGPLLTAPYKLYPGFVYRITFLMLRGDINPSEIVEDTEWDKRSGTSEGPGGIVLAPSNTAINAIVDAELVFDTGTTVDFTSSLTSGNPLKAYYCKRDYDPIAGETFRSTGYEIENNNYVSLFQASPLDITSQSISLVYVSFDDILSFSGVINSGMNVYVDGQLRFEYQANGGTWRNLVTQNPVRINPGNNNWSAIIPMTFFNPGGNTSLARMYFDIKNPNGTYSQMFMDSASRTFTRSA
jgi:hypothetical protein